MFLPSCSVPHEKRDELHCPSTGPAPNPGFKCWLQFHFFLKLWENNLTPNSPVLMLTNPAQTLWSIRIQLMNSCGSCKLTWYYFPLIHWDCKKFTKQSPVSSHEQVVSRHRVTAPALPNSPSPVLGKIWNPADSMLPWLLHHPGTSLGKPGAGASCSGPQHKTGPCLGQILLSQSPCFTLQT